MIRDIAFLTFKVNFNSVTSDVGAHINDSFYKLPEVINMPEYSREDLYFEHY